MKIFYKLQLIVLFLSSCQYPYNQDLEFIYNQIKDNHPGMYNEEDPTFKEDLERNVARAKKSIISDPLQQQQAITVFTKSFNDTHLWVNWSDQKNNPPKTQFHITYITPQLVWITLPTFALNLDQEKDFHLFLNEILTLRKKYALVFDLRGNQGGNSVYGKQIVDCLFGQKYAQQQRSLTPPASAVDWRASPDNLAHVQSLFQRYTWLKEIVKGMTQSLHQQKPYYRQVFVKDPPSSFLLSHPVTARVVVLIDHSNFSAVLDFIDDLKKMGHPITLIGKTTRADRLYIEVRTVNLPSGRGTFSFSIKVYRDRVRKDNEPYKPDFEFDTNNTSKLEEFIINLLQKS